MPPGNLETSGCRLHAPRVAALDCSPRLGKLLERIAPHRGLPRHDCPHTAHGAAHWGTPQAWRPRPLAAGGGEGGRHNPRTHVPPLTMCAPPSVAQVSSQRVPAFMQSRRRLAVISPRLAVISPSPRRISPSSRRVSLRLAASRRRLPTRSAAAPSTPANRAPPVTCLQRASHALAAQQPSRAVSIVSLPRLIVHYQQRASHTAAQQPSRIGLPQPAPASPRQPPPAPASPSPFLARGSAMKQHIKL